MRVFIVTWADSGYYQDHRVIGLFDNRADAEQLQQQKRDEDECCSCGVEEHELPGRDNPSLVEQDYHKLISRQSDLLTKTVNVLRGDPPPLVTWSHHDIPELAANWVAARNAWQKAAQDARAEMADLRTENDRLRAVIAEVEKVHEPIDALMYSGANSRVVKVCTGCGTDDGNWQRYPCPTIRALRGAT